MPFSIDNSNTFLAYYNQLDKYFAYVLWLTKYVPFTEKVNMLTDGRYAITSFVKIYQNKLRYFWDLRNQLVHGFRLDNQHYVLASDHAIEEVKSIYEEARDPKTAGEIFTKKVYVCALGDSLKEVISTMEKQWTTHVPVYNEAGEFVDMLCESTIAYWTASQIATWTSSVDAMKVSDLALQNSNETYQFVDSAKSIYEIEELFTKGNDTKKRLWAVFITEKWTKEEPILWVVTMSDVPALDDHFVL